MSNPVKQMNHRRLPPLPGSSKHVPLSKLATAPPAPPQTKNEASTGWKTNAKVLIIGLDNAGKSTLLTRVSSGRLVQHAPTIQSDCKELSLDGMRIMAYDLGGHRQARRVWRDYFPAVDGVVFMVDAADGARLAEAGAELDRLLRDDMIPDVPVVVLGNKVDRRDAVGEDEIAIRLGLGIYRTGKELVKREKLPSRPVELFPCSIVMETGYGDGLRWLGHYMKQSNNT